MYSLENLFANSSHKKSIFTQEEINFVEEKIYTKTVKEKESPYIKCAVRNKEIKLTPEEAVRQLFIYRLCKVYGYNPAQIKLEHEITFGREKKRADIVIVEENRPTVEYIIVEVKKPKLLEGKEQLKSYCNATGATMGVWTNGEKISFYHRKEPNYFEDIPDIPRRWQKLKDILQEHWTIDDLIAKDKLITERKTLADLIEEMEDEVLANAGVDVFEEVFKLIYTKLYDEMMSGRDKSRYLEFRNYGDTDADLKEVIQNLFNRAKKKWQGVFSKDDKIKLTPSHLAICISSLQNVKLFNSNLDVIDDAFEYLMSKSQKGEKGQFFTPRYVIDMCVKMLNPKKSETMIDTAAGSCGFPVHTIFYVWKNILTELGIKQSHLLTAEPKPLECEDYVNEKVFAIDFDEKAVRVARTLNLIAGDGKTNVLHLNTLDYERWEEIIDQDWLDIYNDGWKNLRNLRGNQKSNRDFNFDIVMANPPFAGDIKESRIIAKYELGKNSKGKYQSKVGRDILFIERNLQFLKPGGRMAIILPQGRFNNSSDKYIRDFIAERCRILAVVGLHGNVFKPHTGTKTSVLFVQKWDDKLCPRRDDYPIFFATMQKPSKDNSGDKIYLLCDDGKFLLDKHKHLIVDHDLFNHDGFTHDGIAEAFIEFAKKENLSFFDSSSFDEVKYKNLSEELECTEILLSEIENENRIDAEFFSKIAISTDNFIRSKKHFYLKENYVVSGPFGSTLKSSSYLEKGDIAFVRIENIKGGFYINTTEIIYISNKDNLRISNSQLFTDDIILSKVGNSIGFFARVDEELSTCNISENNIGIKLNNFIKAEKHFILTYLNSEFGQILILRRRSGNAQPKLNIGDVCKIPIPILPKSFQEKISELVQASHEKLQQAQDTYHAAEKILSAELGLENFKPSTENVAVKSFSSSFGSTGRLDAEFYQPKYDDLKNLLDSLTTRRLDEIVNIFKSIEPGSDFYDTEGIPFIRVSDVNKFEIAEPEIKLSIQVDEQLFPRRDTILFSKDGSVGIAHKVRADMKAITSGALLHLKIKNKSDILPDYLTLVLNSKVVQMQAERDSSGAIIQHWKPSEIEEVIVPILPMAVQEKISAQVEESFRLRSESKRLLELAKRAVEIAIESGEDYALKIFEGENL
ncbi:MAG: N-6 DNA methylase [Selenomonadaceae bacterium]|nr:N-6 DNA methylase [Selenomonadaceae bacterium]